MNTPGRPTVGHNPHEVKINRFNSITGDNNHPRGILCYFPSLTHPLGVYSHKPLKLWLIKLLQVTMFSNGIDGFANTSARTSIAPTVEFYENFNSFYQIKPCNNLIFKNILR